MAFYLWVLSVNWLELEHLFDPKPIYIIRSLSAYICTEIERETKRPYHDRIADIRLREEYMLRT